MRYRLHAFGFALAPLIFSVSQDIAHAEKPRAVIELFTSQGCSSCPPADELLAELATEPGTIVLSLPVDYWDYLGWKDTLARPEFTARQRAYSTARGDLQVYTPQAVVNGVTHAVGSNRHEIASALTNAADISLQVSINLSLSDDAMTIGIGDAPDGTRRIGRLLLMPYLKSRDVAIGRGENARRSVRYTNVVREVIDVSEWNGKPLRVVVPRAKLPAADGYVAILQAGGPGKPGAILGAAQQLSQ